MDIIKAATEWAKAEIVSAKIFMFFGFLFLVGSALLGQFGDTELTQALIYPILVAGGLLVAAGAGFYFSNSKRLANFQPDYEANSDTFFSSEIERTERTIKSYENVAFKVFPSIIVMALLLIFFIDSSFWRGVNIAVIGFFAVLIFLDSKAHKRTKVYHEQLVSAKSK